MAVQFPSGIAVPEYVHTLLRAIPEAQSVRYDSTTRYRCIIMAKTFQVRVNQSYGVILPLSPSQMQLRHAEQLSHRDLFDALLEKRTAKEAT